MTKTEQPTRYAKNLATGDRFFCQGAWHTLAEAHSDASGTWLYSTDGEANWFLGYTSLPYAPAGL